MNNLKEEGIVKKIGCSIYSPDELNFILNSLDVDIIQAPLNLLDRRLIDSGWLSKLKSYGIEVHTRSSFLQGLLLMSIRRIIYLQQIIHSKKYSINGLNLLKIIIQVKYRHVSLS